MDCASCGRANREDARFCDGCGGSLAPRCPSCSRECRPSAQFCDACGAALAPRPAQVATARKVITIVFADLIGSTALHERLDAESVNRVMDRFYRAVRAPIEEHGGSVLQLLGDGVLCAFGVPRVAEDDAIRAVRAAVVMQEAFREFARSEGAGAGPLGLRIAVNTGEVLVGDQQAGVLGDPANVAARLQLEAADGDVLIGEATQRLVADRVTLAPFGTFALKGRAEAVRAFRVVSLERPAGAGAVPFVGREAELERIAAVYEAAVAAPAARLAVVLGSPGLGKSRLLAEFARRLGGGATVLTAQCLAAPGATFAPLAEALRAELHLEPGTGSEALRAAIDALVEGDEEDRARIAGGVGALLSGTPASPEETFFVVRRLLAALASARPVVLAVDDLQWAEPLLLDLTEHLVQWGAGVPLLVLAAARPELRETRSALASPGGLVSEVVTLAGLDAGAATRLAASVIGAAELPAAVAGRVLATSEGNPLFLGELVRMLVNDGALRREGDRWTTAVELADLKMPPTIQALLAARIERLRPDDRLVLERASVVGRHFSRAAVEHLLPAEARADLDARLESLRRSELVESDTGWLLGEPMLRFHHVLIRDAAYRRLLRNTRVELHERFADWLEARAGESIEHDETIGWHLEQAHQHLRELGPLDEHGRELGERAARHLAAAGRRALARDDLLPAAGLLGRALERLDADDPARADLVVDWCEALLAAGDVATASRAIAELGRLMAGSERLRAWQACFSGQLAVLTDPKALRASADAVAAAAETLARAGDAVGEAKAHSIHALVLAQLGRIGACEAVLDKALAAARRAGERRLANAVLAGAPLAALWGPSPVTRASGRCLDVVRVLRITQGAPAVEAVALRCQAVLETLRGRGEAARRMIASSRNLVEELGITQRVLEADLFAGLIELLEGDAQAAERRLRDAWDGLREQGLGIDAAQAGALLARALLAQERIDEAGAVSHESESLAGDSFKAAIAWRGVRAEVLAARGEHAAAIDFARQAVEIAAATDDLLDHADARSSLAVALRAAGRGAEADAEERRAVELWEAKGATLLVERARREAPRVRVEDRAPLERARRARRVGANAASANLDRLAAAFSAGDAEAIDDQLADGAVSVHHPTATSYDRRGLLTTYQSMLKVQRPVFRHGLLATLGDSLALSHMFLTATGFAGQTFDVGAYDREEFCLVDVDSNGRQRRAEYFAAGKLDDALERLYERYAELLPDGPERTRAAAIARWRAGSSKPLRVERVAAGLAGDFEFVDHRTIGFGSMRKAAFLRLVESLLEATSDSTNRSDDVLGVRPDALLLRITNSGTDRATGGAFERCFLQIIVVGADALVSRWEHFDPAREAEALARFGELTAPRAAPGRLRANAATANAARLDAAFRSRDADALAALFEDGFLITHHPTATEFGRDGALGRFQALMRAVDPLLEHRPIATLGDALALCRQTMSVAALAEDDIAPAGPTRTDVIALIEAAEHGIRRVEVFAPHHLGDAIQRLYECYAERLPEGLDRAHAEAVARTVAALFGPADRWRARTPFAPDGEARDHRTVGFGSLRGADAVLRAVVTLRRLSDDFADRFDDVLDLRSDALLVRATTLGTIRSSGGAFEQDLCQLYVFGADGLVARWEQFDAGQEAAALARFDELTARRPAARALRRVRANAATACAEALAAAVSARDLDAAAAVFAGAMQTVHHPTGLAYDREGGLASLRPLIEARGARFELEPIATLGDSLALCQQRVGASAIGGTRFDVGGYEQEFLVLVETGASGLNVRAEMFAPDRLGDAVVRLYERHAELLPDGPERTRTAGAARSCAAAFGPFDLDLRATAFAPAIAFADHQTLGMGSVEGAEAVLRILGSVIEVSADLSTRIDELLALGPDAILAHWTTFGTARVGGGAYERPFLWLARFGDDGLITHMEQFDAGRDAEALARFDELAVERPQRTRRRVRENAATACGDRLRAVALARDHDAIAALCAQDLQVLHHPTGAVIDRAGGLNRFRMLGRAEGLAISWETLATLGDSLALSRDVTSFDRLVQDDLSFGASRSSYLNVTEIDARGLSTRVEVFAEDRLGDAVVCLYERYAELLPEGPARARAAVTARSLATDLGPLDLDRVVSSWEPDISFQDYRLAGIGSVSGAEALRATLAALFDLTSDLAIRATDVLALRSDALLLRLVNTGTDRASGGSFERPFLMAWVFGAHGRAACCAQFDADREAEALARFDELTAAAPTGPVGRRVRPNAVTGSTDRVCAVISARDADALPALVADDIEVVHHPTHSSYGRAEVLRVWRGLIQAPEGRLAVQHLAVLGDSLALSLHRMSAGGAPRGRKFDFGPYEVENLLLAEVDERGRQQGGEVFDADRLAEAVVCLYERYAELLPEGPARARAAATARSVAVFAGPWDLGRRAAAFAPDVEFVDRRSLGFESTRGSEALLRVAGSMVDVAPDVTNRFDGIVDVRANGFLLRIANSGTDRSTGGAFERTHILLATFGADGRATRLEQFDLEDPETALARFDELTAAASARDADGPVAAVMRAFAGALARRDWEALGAQCAPDLVVRDHRRLGWEPLHGPAAYMAALRALVELAPDTRMRLDHVETAARGFLVETVWVGTRDGGPFEDPSLMVGELDAAGRVCRLDQYDLERQGAARARFAELSREARTPLRARSLS